MRVFSSALGRHARNRSLNDLQKRLLNAFSRYIPGDGHVLALLRDLVDLININDPVLRPLHVVIRSLDQLQEDVLHILAHVARFRQRGRIRNGKGHIDDLRQRLRKIGLAGTCGADHDDVALLQLHPVVLFLRRRHPFIVIVNGNRQNLLRLLLPDHIIIQEFPDLNGLEQIDVRCFLCRFFLFVFLVNDVRTDLHAFIADKYAVWPCDQFSDLILRLVAEGTSDLVVRNSTCHFCLSSEKKSETADLPAIPTASRQAGCFLPVRFRTVCAANAQTRLNSDKRSVFSYITTKDARSRAILCQNSSIICSPRNPFWKKRWNRSGRKPWPPPRFSSCPSRYPQAPLQNPGRSSVRGSWQASPWSSGYASP